VTDRISGYIVTLDHDIREDDAKKITKALGMIKGVLSVEPVTADPFAESMYRTRMHTRLVNEVLDVIQKVTFGD
jgi:hypothetical protein